MEKFILKLLEIDGSILIYIQENIRIEWLNKVMALITKLGDKGIFWILLAFGLFCYKKTRKVGLIALIAISGSYLIDNIILKNLVARPRPFDTIEGLTYLIKRPKDYSFPSGHTGTSFAAAVVFLKMLPKKYGVAAIVVAILIGLSRMYLGVHYPSDVLAGALIGTLIALVSLVSNNCGMELTQ